MRRTIVMTLLATSLLVLLPSQALAARGGERGGGKGGKDTSSVTLDVVMVDDADADGVPDHGDTISFAFEQSETTEPHLELICTQGGVVVYGATTGYSADYPWPWTREMTLSSQAWSGGAANCTAELYYYGSRKTVTLGTLSFTVDG